MGESRQSEILFQTLPPVMQITQAHPADATPLTALTFRSKAHWGYSTPQMEAWREELTISSAYMAIHSLFKLTVEGQLVGYYAFVPVSSGKVKLDGLFVEPQHIGKGFGRLLLTDFLVRAACMGFEAVTLDADPHVETFYEKVGFQVVGKLASAIEGRFLPIMEKEIEPIRTG